MPQYLFALGREKEISVAEINSIFSFLKIEFEKENSIDKYLILNSETEIDAAAIMAKLGGTLKISKLILVPLIEHLINTQPTEKITYSIFGDNSKSLALNTKKALKSLGRLVRYIEPKNTATILHNNLVEKQGDFDVVGKNIYCTVAIQPIAEFSERDYGRPSADGKSGMIPPKLARIMINLAELKTNVAILDPFCGSGTILSEALAMGYTSLTGSDNADKAVRDTKANLAWLIQNQKLNIKYKNSEINIFSCNAQSLDAKLSEHSIDAIITEPFLGQPLRGGEPKQILEKQARELSKLYIQSFQSFHKILKPDGVVIFIIPSFKFQNFWIQVPCIDEIKKTGFTPVPLFDTKTSLLYSRPDQHVGRNIWRFKKN